MRMGSLALNHASKKSTIRCTNQRIHGHIKEWGKERKKVKKRERRTSNGRACKLARHYSAIQEIRRFEHEQPQINIHAATQPARDK